jgi:predicted alpha/beta superfamily hydrolase
MGKTGIFRSIFLLFFFIPFVNFYAQKSDLKYIKKLSMEAPQLNTFKQIWVYLPKNYENSKNAYAVIYMHDAQNLFDDKTSYADEWQIDEFLEDFEGTQSIIVGIEHGNEKRLDELTPFSNEKYGGGEGDAYLQFIVDNLKPYMDKEFRTLKDATHTSIMGSSLGGLLSFYAVIKYPEVFGNAGIFSPSFWFSEAIYTFTASSTLTENSRFYFAIGTEESKTAVPDQQKMVHLLLEKGVSKENIVNKIVPRGQHNESFWSSQFPDAYKWLTHQ